MRYNTDMQVKKMSGEQEVFQPAKLCSSIERAGAPKDLALSVCQAVEERVQPGDSTTKIFREALRYLIQEDRTTAARYKLRRALDELGPTGFIFEQYVEALLQAHGYETKRNVMMAGECVTHEVDVYAKKGNLEYLVEAKYRNQHAIKTHIDQVMYADARLMDIERRAKKDGRDAQYVMWVITNTTFTSQAIKYGKCRGVKLVSWNYPRKHSLESMIVRKKMYPITVLSSLSRQARDQFVQHNMVLAQDILLYTTEQLVREFHISMRQARALISEVNALLA